MNKPPFRYYLITNRKKCAPQNLTEVVTEACRNGIKAVQVREKDLSTKELYRLAVKLRGITRKTQTRLFINDRADIAISVDADGVHCREKSMHPNDIKKINSSLLVGSSVHSVELAKHAEENGADFLQFGPVYYTSSKARYGEPQGIDKLRKVCDETTIPVYAVGGITPEHASDCINAGAFGVAGISSIMGAEDIPEKVDQWEKVLKYL